MNQLQQSVQNCSKVCIEGPRIKRTRWHNIVWLWLVYSSVSKGTHSCVELSQYQMVSLSAPVVSEVHTGMSTAVPGHGTQSLLKLKSVPFETGVNNCLWSCDCGIAFASLFFLMLESVTCTPAQQDTFWQLHAM